MRSESMDVRPMAAVQLNECDGGDKPRVIGTVGYRFKQRERRMLEEDTGERPIASMYSEKGEQTGRADKTSHVSREGGR